VQAVLRRTLQDKDVDNVIRLAEKVSVDCQNLCGQRAELALSFTRREVEILQYLKANTQRPVSRDELLDKVWGYANHLHIETRTVDIHIAKLRRKIEPDPAQPRLLITVRGAGYRLLVDDNQHE
jgi:two-component system response regulator RegX3